jgi:hypothetical protein
MVVLHGLIKLIWGIVTLPVHLVLSLIKYFIIGPIVLLITLAVLLVACVALAVPAVLPSVQVPGFITDISTWLSHPTVSLPALPGAPTATIAVPAPANVICLARDHQIFVQWTGQPNSGAQWYQVVRRALEDTDWHRIALVTARDHPAQYEYADPSPQHGVTYRYGVVALGADGAESEVVASSIQIVAP